MNQQPPKYECVPNISEGLHDNEYGIVQLGSDKKWRRINLTQYTAGEATTKAIGLNRYHQGHIQHGVCNARGDAWAETQGMEGRY